MTTAEDAASALRNKQKPLKDKYRSDPSSALVTLSSAGSLDATSLTCSLTTGAAAKKVAGLHQAAGGSGFDVSGELCSGDMLLESLVACFGVTVRAVATALGLAIEGGSVKVEGDLDFRGTMGIKDPDGNAVPVGFKAIRLIVKLNVASEEQEKVGKLIELSERYCVVLQTVRQGVDVKTEVEHVSEATGGEKGDAERKGSGMEMEKTLSNEEVLPLN